MGGQICIKCPNQDRVLRKYIYSNELQKTGCAHLLPSPLQSSVRLQIKINYNYVRNFMLIVSGVFEDLEFKISEGSDQN